MNPPLPKSLNLPLTSDLSFSPCGLALQIPRLLQPPQNLPSKKKVPLVNPPAKDLRAFPPEPLGEFSEPFGWPALRLPPFGLQVLPPGAPQVGVGHLPFAFFHWMFSPHRPVVTGAKVGRFPPLENGPSAPPQAALGAPGVGMGAGQAQAKRRGCSCNCLPYGLGMRRGAATVGLLGNLW
uniref:Uncharacterized protein n=1 Tax=Knipowitschia caucasica TaxID=637954 RepID=A0AAV2KMS9_KNICA